MKNERKIINDKLWNYAKRIDELNTEIQMCNLLINDLANPLKATSYDKEPGKGENNSTVESAVLLRERYCQSIAKSTQEKEKVMREFEAYISPTNITQRAILRDRYINRCNNRKLCYNHNYSEDHIKRLIAEAQDILYNTYKNTAQL